MCVDFTVDSYFQIRLGGVVACAELIVSINSNNYHYFTQMMLQVSSTDRKLSDITAAVVKQLQTSCGECAPEMIDNQFFVCYPESPSHVTYRARLEGTSERGSDSLISLIEDWVSGGPGVIVTGVLMTVDSHCSVAISFLSERECLPPPANTDPTVIGGVDSPAPDTGANQEGLIAGAVVAVVVVVLIIAITIIAIVVIVLKSRRGKVSLKKPETKYVYSIYIFDSVSISVDSGMSRLWWERLPSQPLPMRPM